MNFGKFISNAVSKAVPKMSEVTQPVKTADASAPATQPAATVTETVKKTVTPAPAATAKTNAPNIPNVIRKSSIFGRRFADGGSVGSASKRADGIAQRGKTKGRMV